MLQGDVAVRDNRILSETYQLLVIYIIDTCSSLLDFLGIGPNQQQDDQILGAMFFLVPAVITG